MKTEDRGQRSEDGGRRADDRRKKSEVGMRKSESGGQKSVLGVRFQVSVNRGRWTERRRQIMTTEGHGETRKI